MDNGLDGFAAIHAYDGHITAVESDDDMGRHWTRFDATDPDTGPAVARRCAEYIDRLEAAGELSDIDCTTDCPCVPVTDTGNPANPTVGTCHCGNPWCGGHLTDAQLDGMRDAFAGEVR